MKIVNKINVKNVMSFLPHDEHYRIFTFFIVIRLKESLFNSGKKSETFLLFQNRQPPEAVHSLRYSELHAQEDSSQ